MAPPTASTSRKRESLAAATLLMVLPCALACQMDDATCNLMRVELASEMVNEGFRLRVRQERVHHRAGSQRTPLHLRAECCSGVASPPSSPLEPCLPDLILQSVSRHTLSRQ